MSSIVARPPDLKVNILLVDDQPGNLLALEAVLGDLGQNLVQASSGDQALRLLADDNFAVVLLDVQMQGLDGFETARQIRARERSRHTPIIFMTAYDDDRFPVEEAYSLDAVDYLIKPVIPTILRAKVAGLVEVSSAAARLRQFERQALEQKLSEESGRLREQREWLKITLASIGDAVIATDPEGRVTFLNPVAESLTGWRQDEAEGQDLETIFTILNEQTRLRVENPVARVIRDGTIVGPGTHTVLAARNGTERPIADNAAPIKDAAGRTLGVVLVFRDVTEERRALRALQSSEARKAAILETALDCIISIDHEGNVVEFNPAAEVTFGYRRSEIMGKPMAELIVPASLRERHYRGMAHYFATGEGPVIGNRIEITAMRADGSEIPVELAITRVSTDGPPTFTAYARDLTERRNLDQRRNARLAVRQILAEAVSVEQAAERILRVTCDGLGWDVGALWILDPEASALRCMEFHRARAEPCAEFESVSRQRTFVAGVGLPGRVWQSREPAWIPDVAKDANFPRAAVADHEGLHGAFAFPIAVGPAFRGVIEFFSGEIRQPDPDLLEMMATIGGQIGQFIERKETEESLHRSEQRFAGFMQHLPGLAWIKDVEGRYVFANDAAENAFRVPRERLYGRTDDEVFPPETAAQFKENDTRALLSDAGVQLVESLEQADGVHYSLVSKFPIHGPDRRAALVGGIAIDITERMRAEEQTRFQAQLLDAVEQAAIATDPEGKIIYWNRFAESLYGWSKGEAIGRNILETIVAPAAEGAAAEIMAHLRSGRSWSSEFLVRQRDGTVFPAHVTDTPIVDAHGQVEAIIGISVDITKQKQTERTLRFLAEASAALSALVDYESTLQKVAELAVPQIADWCAIDMTEPDGTLRRLAVAHVDPSKATLVHELENRFTADRTQTRGPYHVLWTGRSEIAEQVTAGMLAEAARNEQHLHLLRELNPKSYLCVPFKVRDRVLGVITLVMAESGRRYGGDDLEFAEELARRSAIAIENAQLYDGLREADRLKDEFLAMLAHELRNPLAPIRNALQVMKMPEADAATLEQMRNMAGRQVHHMARLLDDLLDMSRISHGRIELRKEPVDVASLVNRTVEAVHSLIEGRHHRLTVSLPPESLKVEGDPTRLEQVLTNLLNNAAKYTDPGGEISLTISRQDTQVILQVRDTGIGIAPEMLPRIFDLFVQADRRVDRSQGGLGIGLTLVRKLVEMHGGTVNAASKGVGQGSEFVVRLPALRGELQRGATGDDSAIVFRSAASRSVLVVDDNHDAADSLSMLLKLSGHTVRTVYSGPEALQTVQAQPPEVILLDIGMPGMDGYEVARSIRRTPCCRATVLVALTGWGQVEDRRRAKEAGFDQHFVKPVELTALNKLLANFSKSEVG